MKHRIVGIHIHLTFFPSDMYILSELGFMIGPTTFDSQSFGSTSSKDTLMACSGQPHSSRNTSLILSATRLLMSSSFGYALISMMPDMNVKTYLTI